MTNQNIYDPSKTAKFLSFWLFVMMVLVMAMIVLGGATRLTNSGLSITEWKPITGALPPLSQAAWLAEFEKYKQIPEFRAEHPDMDLKGFEFIYFMEWSHRQLGRLIGLVYAVPFFIYLFGRKLPPGRTVRFWGILLLIGLQGAIGWWMVASGLKDDRVDVSQYRLATHLGMAFIILGALFWTWRDSRESWPDNAGRALLSRRTGLLAFLIYLQIIAGAFVAGTHSGKTYNTWPAMDGGFVPSGYGVMTPFWKNLFENSAAIQFNHRFLAYLILALLGIVAIGVLKSRRLALPFWILAGLILWQVGLGIWTLLAVAPLNLSLLHQFSSILVFLGGLWLWRSALLSRAY